VVGGERPQLRVVLGRRRIEDAEHQHDELDARRVEPCADGHLDLREPVADRERADELAQPRQQRRDARRQHVAFAHVGDVARLALVEAHEHAALLRDVANRQPRPRAVAPCRPVDRRQERRGRDASDARERVLERALLGGDLQRRGGVLQRAAAAHPEVRAARRDAVGGGDVDAHGARQVPRRLAPERLDGDGLAGQRALDEHRLAFDAGDAAALVVERGDVDGDHEHGPAGKRALYRATPRRLGGGRRGRAPPVE